MKGSLTCCLRAVVKQASTQRQQQLAELQGGVTAVAACGQRSSFGSQHRQFHSSHTPEIPDSVESASQASTSASRSTFPIPSRKPQSTRGDATRASGGRHHQPSVEQVTLHLNTLFEGLQRPIPPELAWRMVTHKGAVPANTIEAVQHNDKLSLIGAFPCFFLPLCSFNVRSSSDIAPEQVVGFCDSTFLFSYIRKSPTRTIH